MNKGWARALELGGIAGLLGLSFNLVAPVIGSYINGSHQILFYTKAWEIGFEPYLFAFTWFWGLLVLIHRWRAK